MDANDKIQQRLAELRKSLSPDQARALLDQAEEILSRMGTGGIVGIKGPELLIPRAVPPEVPPEAPPNASEVPEVSKLDNSDRPTRTNSGELGRTRTTESELKVALKATESELKVTESAPFQVDIYRERRKP